MHALPFLVSLVAGRGARAGSAAHASGGRPLASSTIAAEQLPFPFGVLTLAAALIALIPLTLLEQGLGVDELFHPETLPIAMYALGVLALGLVDDTLGESGRTSRAARPRGWRGHGAAAAAR